MSKRSKIIRKSNQLIEAKYKLSLHESKILAYLISQVQINDSDFKEHNMSAQLLSETCNIPKSKVYPKVAEIAEKLQSKVIKIHTDDGGWDNVNLFYRSSWRPKKGTFIFILHPDLRPMLLDLKSNYTQYSLLYALRFRSSYSIRIYEFCLKRLRESKKNSIKFEMSLDLFKDLLEISAKYSQYSSLRQRVLNAAVPEINSITDVKVKVIAEKTNKSRAINNLVFEVEKSADNFPNVVKELMKFDVRPDVALHLYEEYGGEQISEKIKTWFYYLTTKELPDGGTMKNPAGFIIDKIREGGQASIDDELRRHGEQRTLSEIEAEERELTQKGTASVPSDQITVERKKKKSAKNQFAEIRKKLDA